MVTDLKAKAFVSDVGKRNENQEYLRSTVSDFTACVSVLHQQRHTMLLSELLSIPLWDCNQASFPRAQGSTPSPTLANSKPMADPKLHD